MADWYYGYSKRPPIRPIEKYTLRINDVWVNDDDFKKDCETIGVEFKDFYTSKYLYLLKKIYGNIYIRFVDREMARLSAIIHFQKLLKQYEIDDKIWNLSIDDLKVSISESENEIYATNEADLENNRKYLVGSNKAVSKQNNSILEMLPIIKTLFQGEYSPLENIITNLAKFLALPMQPNNDDLSKEGNYHGNFWQR